jgi:peptidoglycan-N-acetylglucosamine deacetylase
MADGFRWPEGYRAAACFTFDMDAESSVLWDRPETAGYLDVMTHQAYGPRTGIPRILGILERHRLRATWFIPGFSAERWPEVARSIRDAGHEIAHHGYLHERSRGATAEVEEGRLVRGLEALATVLGVRPIGYRAPLWQMSYATPGLLARHGFQYDCGLMDSDFPYEFAVTPEPGAPTLVELGSHWSLDDGPAYNYQPGISGSGVILSPTVLLERWALELDAIVRAGGLFVPTIHPFISGRASRAEALDKLIGHARELGDVWLATGAEIATHVRSLGLPPVVHRPPVVDPAWAPAVEEGRP